MGICNFNVLEHESMWHMELNFKSWGIPGVQSSLLMDLCLNGVLEDKIQEGIRFLLDLDIESQSILILESPTVILNQSLQ